MQTTFTMRQLLEAGVHFGHNPRRWNPKMKPYIYGVRNSVHIINLEHTAPMLQTALQEIKNIASQGGRILFVGTKRQASEMVAETAKRCGQYYVNHRWLGGMLTNWRTVSQSIKRLKELDTQLQGNTEGLTKKEMLNLDRQREKLEKAIGGIKEMGGVPELVFVIDTGIEDIAIQEANALGIPVVAIVDTNNSPDGVDFPIPGNDDAVKSLALYLDLAANAILEGLRIELTAKGVDLGASTKAPVETAIAADDGAAATAETPSATAEAPEAAAAEAKAKPAKKAKTDAAPKAAAPKKAKKAAAAEEEAAA